MMKSVILCAVVAVALARPQTYGPPAAPPPSFEPFGYQYGVRDALSGADFEKTEAQDLAGNVAGSYRVNLPDGRVQIVTYHAGEGGFVADVQYEGTPIVYEAPARPAYAVPSPAYVPA